MSHPPAGNRTAGSATVAHTQPLTDDLGDLLAHLPAAGGVAWIHAGEGMVAWGEAAQVRLSGPDQFERAAEWWQRYSAAVQPSGSTDAPVAGPIMFGSFAFDESTGTSVIVVPEVVLTRRDGRSWLTVVRSSTGRVPALPTSHPIRPPGQVRWSDGSAPVMTWGAAVAAAVARIDTGELAKVVLARDVLAETEFVIDPRHLLGRLAERYPSCWTFAVDGLVGATPELLVRRTGPDIVSLVLAGTMWDHNGTDRDRLAAEIIASAKEQEEHGYAAQSVAEALAGYCSQLSVPAAPEVVPLANVVHLGTLISGRLAVDTDALTLAAALHPTPAVAGTPTELALKVIKDLEGMDRGRFAGPVGWMDAHGNGEWCIALRCAEVRGNRARLFAGVGVVAGSVPATEIAETQAKFAPMRDALSG